MSSPSDIPTPEEEKVAREIRKLSEKMRNLGGMTPSQGRTPMDDDKKKGVSENALPSNYRFSGVDALQGRLFQH